LLLQSRRPTTHLPSEATLAFRVAASVRTQHVDHQAARAREQERHAARLGLQREQFQRLYQAMLLYHEAERRPSDLEKSGSCWNLDTLLAHCPAQAFRRASIAPLPLPPGLEAKLRASLCDAIAAMAQWGDAPGPHRTALAQVLTQAPTEADCRLLVDAMIKPLLEHQGHALRTEVRTESRHLPVNRLDYCIYDAAGIAVGVLEAKRLDLLQGFVQCCTQLLTLQARERDGRRPIFGIVADGFRYLLLWIEGPQVWVDGPGHGATGHVRHADSWQQTFAIAGRILALLRGTPFAAPQPTPPPPSQAAGLHRSWRSFVRAPDGDAASVGALASEDDGPTALDSDAAPQPGSATPTTPPPPDAMARSSMRSSACVGSLFDHLPSPCRVSAGLGRMDLHLALAFPFMHPSLSPPSLPLALGCVGAATPGISHCVGGGGRHAQCQSTAVRCQAGSCRTAAGLRAAQAAQAIQRRRSLPGPCQAVAPPAMQRARSAPSGETESKRQRWLVAPPTSLASHARVARHARRELQTLGRARARKGFARAHCMLAWYNDGKENMLWNVLAQQQAGALPLAAFSLRLSPLDDEIRQQKGRDPPTLHGLLACMQGELLRLAPPDATLQAVSVFLDQGVLPEALLALRRLADTVSDTIRIVVLQGSAVVTTL
jgi:hypothetical protein